MIPPGRLGKMLASGKRPAWHPEDLPRRTRRLDDMLAGGKRPAWHGTTSRTRRLDDMLACGERPAWHGTTSLRSFTRNRNKLRRPWLLVKQDEMCVNVTGPFGIRVSRTRQASTAHPAGRSNTPGYFHVTCPHPALQGYKKNSTSWFNFVTFSMGRKKCNICK